VPTCTFSSYARAREVANTLKEWIRQGRFTLTQPAITIDRLNNES